MKTKHAAASKHKAPEKGDANTTVRVNHRAVTPRQSSRGSVEKRPRASNRSSRRMQIPSWSDPKSPDWDVIRVLNSDECLAPDPLLKLPPSERYSYIDSNGKLKDPHKYDIYKDEAAPHPNLQRHIDLGTDTPELHLYYKHMPDGVFAPLAGVPKLEDEDMSLLARVSVVRTASNSSRGSLPSDSSSDGSLSRVSEEASYYHRPSVKIAVPDHIKAILVDDWENVTKNQQLVPVPAVKPVATLLGDYLESEQAKREPGSAQADILVEVVAGLKEYFDKCLGRVLLYRFERAQYLEIHEASAKLTGDLAGKSASDLYGAEHLCRLLVTLPELIAQTNMDAQSVSRLREELTKLTTWIGRNASTYFVREYETPGPAYVEKARSVT